MQLKRLTTIVAAAGLIAAPVASAVTTIQNPINEGVLTYNNIVIGDGCILPDGSKAGIVAQSVVFPTVKPVVTISGTFSGNPAAISISTLAGVPQLIQNRDIFGQQKTKKDARGNVIGFEGFEGVLDLQLQGLVPFRTTAVSFPSDSCASMLVVRIAVADICEAYGTKNLWIPSVTPKYSDPKVVGIGSPVVLTVNRDVTKNPLPASCGAGYILTVSPSAEDIDTNLKLDDYLL